MKKYIIITSQNSPYYCQDLHPRELISDGMVWCVAKDNEQEIEVAPNEFEILPTLWEAIKAREEGKEVLRWNPYYERWIEKTGDVWEGTAIHRIIESPKPQYIPYTFDDAPEIAALGFGVFEYNWCTIQKINSTGVYFAYGYYYTYDECLSLVKKPDGEPFGKKVEP